jgi:hypothetical protein
MRTQVRTSRRSSPPSTPGSRNRNETATETQHGAIADCDTEAATREVAVRKLCLFAVLVACSTTSRPPGNNNGSGDAGECTDGTRRCEGNTFEVCTGGVWKSMEQCPNYCTDGGCSACPDGGCPSESCMSVDQQSYLGCEYWAVDLDNATEVFGKPEMQLPPGMECSLWPSSKRLMGVRACYDGTWATAGKCDPPDESCPAGFTCSDMPDGLCALDGDGAPFAIVVSNPNGTAVAVTIEITGGQSMTVPVDPGQIQAIFPQQLGFPDQGIDGTMKAARAYKITSSQPIVAYQFNPLNNVDVFSNDASLLIPRGGFDQRYIAVSYTTLTRRSPPTTGVAGRDNYNGYVTVVAWQDDTEIQVTPSADTVAGKDGTPAMVANQPQNFTLNAFDVLSFEAVAGSDPSTNDGLNGGDLTGTQIQGTNGKSFGVFGGHEAVRISGPMSNCCADHLEEMLFPTSTWGKQFAIARTTPRRDVPDILRIVAAVPGTQITISPPPFSGACGTLQANEHCDVQITEPTEVTGTQPITVAHIMMSAINNQDGMGDPSLGIIPPIEQYRTDYKFLAPADYALQYVGIVGVAGDTITLDSQPVTGLQPFGANHVWAAPMIDTGAHTISCPLKCSVEVYGWSQAVSYLFAGGLDLHQIVIQ